IALYPNVADYRDFLVRAYVRHAWLLVGANRSRDAGNMLKKAGAIDTHDPEMKNELAWFLATCPDPELRDPTRARSLAEGAVTLAPHEAGYWNTLGIACYRTGDLTAALKSLEKGVALSSGGSVYDWLFFAMIRSRLGDRKNGRKWLEKAVKWIDENSPQDEE